MKKFLHIDIIFVLIIFVRNGKRYFLEGHLLIKHLTQTSRGRKSVNAQGKNINVITQIELLVPVCILLYKI
jgi:hypothetical protein